MALSAGMMGGGMMGGMGGDMMTGAPQQPDLESIVRGGGMMGQIRRENVFEKTTMKFKKRKR